MTIPANPESTPVPIPPATPEPEPPKGLRFGLYLKLVLAYAVLMLAVYAFIPYFVVRAETSNVLHELQAGTPVNATEAVRRISERSRLAVLVASLINAVLMLFGVMLLRLAVRPVRQVSAGLRSLARNQKVDPVYTDTGDEIADLASSFNWLSVELERYRAELAQREAELERRVVERTRELAAQKQFSETILETAEFGVVTVDPEMRITTWNRALEQILSTPREAVLGKPFGEVMPMTSRDALASELRNTLSTGKSNEHREFESTVEVGGGSGGRWFCCDVATVPLRDTPSGSIVGGLVTIYDVTERKELHMQLSQSAKLAAVGELAGGVAHEINNPLAIILGNAELLIDDLAENPMKKQAETIKRHALRCKEIVANLLKFAGRTAHGSGPVDLKRLLEETLALLRKQLELDNIRIDEKYDALSGTVIGSSDELQQLFFSLISNARDAMPKGGTLTVEMRRDGSAADVVITDTGMGIPKENLERVFSPFFTTKDPGKGTGLGLAIAHTIAQKHGGRIGISSEVDKGTVVTVRLPLMEEPKAEARPAAESRQATAPSKRAQMRVLLVDDEVGIRMVCREALERMKHQVTEAEDGLQALSKLNDGPYDLILMDLKMPNMDGAETLKRIRERDRVTPVLIMTGLIDEEMLASVPENAFVGILKKPFQISELKGWIAKFAEPAKA